jgi:flavin reductase (DIM6/NTAB) family NADH-FMN oxidoreductase RutF
MQENWIEAFGTMTYGIYVLTTFHEAQINAMIASWVSQLSYKPPLVTAAVHPSRYSHELIEQSGSFALHTVSKGQTGFLTRFKGDDPGAKFAGIKWTRGKTGCPILKECIAYLECTVKAAYRPGNHTLFIGEVVDARRFSNEDAFTTLDYMGQYIGNS